MAEAVLTILGCEMRVSCDDAEARRLRDLARELERRAALASGDTAARLTRTAMALLAENQAAGAALARAHAEIDRLNDMLLARAAAPAPATGGRRAALVLSPGAKLPKCALDGFCGVRVHFHPGDRITSLGSWLWPDLGLATWRPPSLARVQGDESRHGASGAVQPFLELA